jgi:BASS family bile acid:Na+ symporter
MVLLLVALVLILVGQAAAMRALLGNGTLLAAALYIVAGLLVGHVFGGPHSPDRTVLALATVTRHPAVALAAAAAVFPGQTQATAAVLLILIVGMVATAPYAAWRRRHPDAGTPSHGSHLHET